MTWPARCGAQGAGGARRAARGGRREAGGARRAARGGRRGRARHGVKVGVDEQRALAPARAPRDAAHHVGQVAAGDPRRAASAAAAAWPRAAAGPRAAAAAAAAVAGEPVRDGDSAEEGSGVRARGVLRAELDQHVRRRRGAHTLQRREEVGRRLLLVRGTADRAHPEGRQRRHVRVRLRWGASAHGLGGRRRRAAPRSGGGDSTRSPAAASNSAARPCSGSASDVAAVSRTYAPVAGCCSDNSAGGWAAAWVGRSAHLPQVASFGPTPRVRRRQTGRCRVGGITCDAQRDRAQQSQ